MSRRTPAARPLNSMIVEGREWITFAEFARRLKVTPEAVGQWAAKRCPILGRRLPTRAFDVERRAGKRSVRRQLVMFVEARYVDEILAKAAQSRDLIEWAGERWHSESEAARIASVSVDSIRRWRREPCPHLSGRRIRTRTEVVHNFPRRGKRAKLFHSECDCRAIAAALAAGDADLMPVTAAATRLGYFVGHVRRFTKHPVPALGNRPMRSEYRTVRDRRGNARPKLCVSRADVETIRGAPETPVAERIEWSGETWLSIEAAARLCGVTPSAIRDWYTRNCAPLGRRLRTHRVPEPARRGRVGCLPQTYVALADVEAIVKAKETGEKRPRPVAGRIERNGKTWLSDTAAAAHAGVSRWEIRRGFNRTHPLLGRKLETLRIDEGRKPGMGRGRLPRIFVALADVETTAAKTGNGQATAAANGGERAAAPKGKAGRPARRRRRAVGAAQPLTGRQTEAIKLHGEHNGNLAAIARAMGIDRKTAEQHVKAALTKLGKSAAKPRTESLPTDRRGQVRVAEGDDERRYPTG